MEECMNRVKLALFPGLFFALMVTLLMTAQVARAASFMGGSWSIVKSAIAASNDIFYAVAAASTSSVWTVGTSKNQPMTEHWNGTAWSVVQSPSTGTEGSILSGVTAISTNDAWAVGYYTNRIALTRTLVEHWNGTAWKIVKSVNPETYGMDYLTRVTATSASDVWAVGYTCSLPDCGGGSSEQASELVEHWDGTAWSVVLYSFNGDNAYLTDVTAVSANDIWTVGYHNDCWSCGPYQTLIEHWDGTSWSRVSSPNSGYQDVLNAVTAISANSVWAVGEYANDYTNQPLQTLTEHWNGTSWSAIASPNPSTTGNNILNGAAAISASDVWA